MLALGNQLKEYGKSEQLKGKQDPSHHHNIVPQYPCRKRKRDYMQCGTQMYKSNLINISTLPLLDYASSLMLLGGEDTMEEEEGEDKACNLGFY